MPVTGTPTATAGSDSVLTLEDVRGFLRDVAGQVPGTGVTNIMFDLPEFSDDDVNRAIKFTVARYNVMPPLVDYVSATTMNIWLLLMGVSEFLCRSEAFRQNRNQVSYPDGEAAVGIDDKLQQYLAIAQSCREEFEEKTRAYKVTLNAESCYGSLGSGFRSVARFFHAS